MNSEKLESDQNIHVLGISYIYNYLCREGYAIHEVNTDPDYHFQLLAQRDEGFILVAVRTALHPDFGTIDKITHEQLIKESNHLNAIPHFAGLAASSLKTNDMKIDGLTGGREYEVTFNGITVVDNTGNNFDISFKTEAEEGEKQDDPKTNNTFL